MALSRNNFIKKFSHLTDGEDLESVHTDFRIEDLKLTVASIYHEHDSIHWESMQTVKMYYQ